MDSCPAFELRVTRLRSLKASVILRGWGGVPDDELNPEYTCNILLKGMHRIQRVLTFAV